MKNNKYKILVLSDLKDSASTTLISTVSLANMIGGRIDFFHVKKPTDIVERDNQLSAIRSINEKHTVTKNKIQSIIDPITKEYGIDINYKFSFGNVKSEIEKYIKKSQPDIIVLGKRKSNLFKLVGDSITYFVLKNYNGVIMIAANTNALEPNRELSLGVLNGKEQTFNVAFAEDLMGYSQKPLKSFKIINNTTFSNETATISNNKTVEYAFEQGDNAFKNLSKYLIISNTNLLYVDRTERFTNDNKSIIDSDIQNVMDHLNVSLLFGNSQTILK